MELTRAWRRRLLGGVVAAVAVPGVVLAAGAATGGFGGFRALAQAVSGPALPMVEPALPTPANAASRLLARSADAALEAPAAAAAAARAGDAAGPATSPRRTRVRPPTNRPNGDGGGGGPDGGPAPPASPPATGPAPAPTPTPEPPSPVRQVGDTVKRVTDQVPVAGGPAGEVVDMLVETIEALPLP